MLLRVEKQQWVYWLGIISILKKYAHTDKEHNMYKVTLYWGWKVWLFTFV